MPSKKKGYTKKKKMKTNVRIIIIIAEGTQFMVRKSFLLDFLYLLNLALCM